jgi:hypothetical protein
MPAADRTTVKKNKTCPVIKIFSYSRKRTIKAKMITCICFDETINFNKRLKT